MTTATPSLTLQLGDQQWVCSPYVRRGESPKVETAFKAPSCHLHLNMAVFTPTGCTTSLKAVNTRQSDFLPLLK